MQCFPLYDDSLGLKWSATEGEAYKRKVITGELSFYREDYIYIVSKPLNERIFLEIYEDETLIETCRFTRRMGQTNLDDQSFKVAPDIVDGYEDFLVLMNNKVNWLDHSPAFSELECRIRPILQIYEAGSRNITCYSKDGYWVQQVENVITSNFKLTSIGHDGCNFGQPFEVFYGVVSPYFSIGMPIFTNNENPQFRIQEEAESNPYYPDPDNPYEPPQLYRYRVYRISDNEIFWESGVHGQQWLIEQLVFFAVHPSVAGTVFQLKKRSFYLRVVGNNLTNARLLPNEDILPRGFFRHAAPVTAQGMMVQIDAYKLPIGGTITTDANHFLSQQEQTTGDLNLYWGMRPHLSIQKRRSDGFYFLAPTGDAIPVDADGWDMVSFWYETPAHIDQMLSGNIHRHTIRHVYGLHEIIKAILKGVGSDIKFEPGDAPILELNDSGVTQWKYLCFTPKSNVTTFQYSIAASKSEFSLKEILELLKTVFRVFWHIENGRLKLNHISYYLRGGYDEALNYFEHHHTQIPNQLPAPFFDQLDLSKLKAKKSLKALDFGLRQITYADGVLPEGYEYEWMDESSQFFRGFGVQFRRTYTGNRLGVFTEVDTRRVDNLSTDLLYTLINPARVSRDGLFGFMVDTDRGYMGGYPITIAKDPKNITPETSIQISLMNGYMSFLWLLDNLHGYDLPTRHVHINQYPRRSITTQAVVIQQVDFPFRLNADAVKGIRSSLGFGVVKELSVNFTNKYATGQINMGEPTDA